MPVNLPDAPQTALNIPSPDVELGGSAVGSAGFGGFATGRAGSGAGRGQGIRGSTLVPLSTARPQIPREAYEAGIEGWVEVVFYVTAEGRVTNIRIVDAQPRGVFEAAMIESVRNWIYPQSTGAREVQQRFEFKLDDYQYNWN
ncbi:MAG: TonB family protein [Oceanococcaceae bacterium]